MEAPHSQTEKAADSLCSIHFWAIATLVTLLATSYYWEEIFGSQWLPSVTSMLSTEYVHDLHRSLFLIPMIYAATVFHLRGAVVMSMLTIIIILPRSIALSPHHDSVLRTAIFVAVAGMAVVILGIERVRRQELDEEVIDRRHTEERLKQAQVVLSESETRYRALFDNATDAILAHDLNGNIIMANQSMANLNGYTAEELVDMNISQMLSESSFTATMDKQRTNARYPRAPNNQRYELHIITKDGTEKPIEVMTSLIPSEEHHPIVQVIARDITEQRRIQENLRTYASLVTQAQEEERKRISRELHDETIQSLARLGLDVDSLISTSSKLPQSIPESLEKLRSRIDETLKGVRYFSQNLRPPMLEDLGLLDALQWMANDISSHNDIDISIQVLGMPRRIISEKELSLFRIVQEALSNIQQHSQATNVVIQAKFDSQNVKLIITDNGQGFEIPGEVGDFASIGKLGLMGMQERAALIDATFDLRSELGTGTTVTVSLNE